MLEVGYAGGLRVSELVAFRLRFVLLPAIVSRALLAVGGYIEVVPLFDEGIFR